MDLLITVGAALSSFFMPYKYFLTAVSKLSKAIYRRDGVRTHGHRCVRPTLYTYSYTIADYKNICTRSRNIQGAIQKFEYVSNCALSSGAICLFTVLLSISLSCCVKFLWHLDVEKLRYRGKSDSTFVVSVEKWTSNKERTSSLVLNIYQNSSNDEKSLWRRLSIP